MTNYEAIKAMDQHELAGFLAGQSRHVVIVRHLMTVMVMEYVRRLCWNG